MQYKKLITIMLLVTYILSLQTKDEIATTINCLAMTKSQLLQESRALSLRGHEVSEAISSENPVIASEAGQSIPPVIARNIVTRQSQYNSTIRMHSKFASQQTREAPLIMDSITNQKTFNQALKDYITVVKFIVKNYDSLTFERKTSLLNLPLIENTYDISIDNSDTSILNYSYIKDGRFICSYFDIGTNKFLIRNNKFAYLFRQKRFQGLRAYIKGGISSRTEFNELVVLSIEHNCFKTLNQLFIHKSNDFSYVIDEGIIRIAILNEYLECLKILTENSDLIDFNFAMISFSEALKSENINVHIIQYLFSYYYLNHNNVLIHLLKTKHNLEMPEESNKQDYLNGLANLIISNQIPLVVAQLLGVYLSIGLDLDNDDIDQQIEQFKTDNPQRELDYIYNYLKFVLCQRYLKSNELDKAVVMAEVVYGREIINYRLIPDLAFDFYRFLLYRFDKDIDHIFTHLQLFRSLFDFRLKLLDFLKFYDNNRSIEARAAPAFADVEIITQFKDSNDRNQNTYPGRLNEIKTVHDKQRKLIALKNLLNEMESNQYVSDIDIKQEIQDLIIELEQQRNEIKQAIINRDLTKIRRLVDRTNINFKDEFGISLFFYAIVHNPMIADYYIGFGFDLSQRNEDGESLLDKLIDIYYKEDSEFYNRPRFYKILKKLKDYRFNFNLLDKRGQPLLYIAIKEHDNLLFDLLTSIPEIDLNIKTQLFERSIIIWAAHFQREDYLARLITLGADINQTDEAKYSSLQLALSKGSIDILRELLENNPRIEWNDNWIKILADNTPMMGDQEGNYFRAFTYFVNYLITQQRDEIIDQIIQLSEFYRDCVYNLLNRAIFDINLRQETFKLIENAEWGNDYINNIDDETLLLAIRRADHQVINFLSRNSRDILSIFLENIRYTNDLRQFQSLYDKLLDRSFRQTDIADRNQHLIMAIFCLKYLLKLMADSTFLHRDILNERKEAIIVRIIDHIHVFEGIEQNQTDLNYKILRIYEYAFKYGIEGNIIGLLENYNIAEEQLIHYALTLGRNFAIVKWLVEERGIDINGINEERETLLDVMLRVYEINKRSVQRKKQFREIISYLLENNARCSGDIGFNKTMFSFHSIVSCVFPFFRRAKDRTVSVGLLNTRGDLNLTQEEYKGLKTLRKLLSRDQDFYKQILYERYLYDRLYSNSTFNFLEEDLTYFLEKYRTYKYEIMPRIEYLRNVEISSREDLLEVKQRLEELKEILELDMDTQEIEKFFKNIIRQKQKTILSTTISRQDGIIIERILLSNGLGFTITKNEEEELENIEFNGSILGQADDRDINLALQALKRIKQGSIVRNTEFLLNLLITTQRSLLKLREFYIERNIERILGIEEAGYILNAV